MRPIASGAWSRRDGGHGRCYLHRCRSLAPACGDIIEALDFETILADAAAQMRDEMAKAA
jgi:hypothetical protein